MQRQFYIHNGYCGWAYGTPSNPQLISDADASRIMEVAGISKAQAEVFVPPAQYAEEGDALFNITGGNRFIVFATPKEMADIQPQRVGYPLSIAWPTPH